MSDEEDRISLLEEVDIEVRLKRVQDNLASIQEDLRKARVARLAKKEAVHRG